MELWTPPLSEQAYASRWQALADEAAFAGPFTRAFTGSRRYVHLEAVVLPAAEHQLLTEASAALGAVLTRVTEWVQRNPLLLPVLGIAPELEPWVTREPGVGPFAVLARLDWLQDARGRWWCLECNADTPGGLPEATVWQSLALSPAEAEPPAVPPPDRFADPNAGLSAALGAALREALPGVAGFATHPGHLEDWENTLAAAGARGGAWVAGGLPELGPDGRLTLDGVAIDSLYRFYPGDWLVRRPDLLARLSDGFPCANPGRALIAQSKASFALLWHLVAEGQFLTPAERDWVRAFVPRTALEPLPDPWVAKPYWEREGWGVRSGAGAGPADPGCIYQERVEPATLPLPLRTLTGMTLAAAVPVVGVYLVGGRPEGYLTRLGGPVTDRSAHMAPTVVGQ